MSLDEIHIPGPRLGAVLHRELPDRTGCDFLVWAPYAEKVELCLGYPEEKAVSMQARKDGYFNCLIEEMPPDGLYQFRLFPPSGEPVLRADPASRLQPQGVHGPSQVVDPAFDWSDNGWNGPELDAYIIYELHVGTATAEGTFDALIPILPELRELGITAVEIMPVAEFPGERNWGYDGVYPFAAHHAYGGPSGLKRLVDASHRTGLAVIMDVVYNHMGPEGNYLRDFGPYFTDAYSTPWGQAINFDHARSDHVRRFFLENARYWLSECRIDALRVDAVHGIYDFSARPFLSELTQLVADESRSQKRRLYCIAESDLNDTRIIRPRPLGGMAFDAQWNDDFHHALHSLLTGERDGYYADFGTLEDLADAWRRGYVYDGRYSQFRQRRHGNDPSREPPGRFVVYSQNHDQVGNRMRGDRLTGLLDFAQLKLAAACVLLSPYIPLLFMGEEYAEPAPFAYFVSHHDPGLVEAVRKGRKAEFSSFQWREEPPDPQSPDTFRQSGLNRSLRHDGGRGEVMYAFYRELIALRKGVPALSNLHRRRMAVKVFKSSHLLYIRRRHGTSDVQMLFHFSGQPLKHKTSGFRNHWRKRLDTAEARWMGPETQAPDSLGGTGGGLYLMPWQALVYERIAEETEPMAP